MDQEEGEIINIKQFIDSRIPLLRDDFFVRNKNVSECIKSDMQLPESALANLEEMCKYEASFFSIYDYDLFCFNILISNNSI